MAQALRNHILAQYSDNTTEPKQERNALLNPKPSRAAGGMKGQGTV